MTIDDLLLEADQLSVNQAPTRNPYLLHYNQPLTNSSGPTIQQLTEPSVSPWRNNTWYQHILRDYEIHRPISFVREASSSYSTPDMSLFETNKPLLHEANLRDNNNFMDNAFYNMNPWPTAPTLTSGEQLFPPLPPKAVTTVDRGDQYVNPFVQPHVPIRRMSGGGQNFPPMNSENTRTNLPFE